MDSRVRIVRSDAAAGFCLMEQLFEKSSGDDVLAAFALDDEQLPRGRAEHDARGDRGERHQAAVVGIAQRQPTGADGNADGQQEEPERDLPSQVHDASVRKAAAPLVASTFDERRWRSEAPQRRLASDGVTAVEPGGLA